jgi:hypothetical protein
MTTAMRQAPGVVRCEDEVLGVVNDNVLRPKETPGDEHPCIRADCRGDMQRLPLLPTRGKTVITVIFPTAADAKMKRVAIGEDAPCVLRPHTAESLTATRCTQGARTEGPAQTVGFHHGLWE